MDDKPTPLTYGSLFAGVGGFDMGMEQAGYEPVFQVEWDKNCLKVLHHHWPTVPKWGDVCDVNGADLPPCDVLIFGSPCQDLSVAGKRAGLQDGEKSSMFFEAVRIIKEMRDATSNVYPRATIWENVPGALSSNRGADFATVLASLADIGANLQEYAVLDLSLIHI
jgi:DNA (cytosine-5)-methyltransferase 1